METITAQQAKFVFHPAKERGTADYGWLKANYSFSFSNYYDPKKMGFGALRVLNDDYIAGGMGFGTHPHDNMEIVTIPIFGALEHKDSKGNTGVIKKGDVQIMSAGTGIKHSEYNHSKTEQANTLQTWVLPNQRNVTPRYEQISVDPSDYKNKLRVVVAPNTTGAMHIHQNSVYAMGELDAGVEQKYDFRFEGNGVYVFVIEGDVEVLGKTLNARDAIGVWETKSLILKPKSKSRVLLIEVPMN